jgi:hypothetical protein
MAILFRFLLVLAVMGLVLSLIAHVAALLGLPQPLGSVAFGLHFGCLVMGAIVVLVHYQLVAEFKWNCEAAMRGCPSWMRVVVSGFGAYAIVNHLLFILLLIAFPPPPRGPADGLADAPPQVFRIFSGAWMFFYSFEAAIFYSAMVVAQRDPARRCSNGHPVSPSASFCPACGARVSEAEFTESSAIRDSQGTE